MVSKIVERAVHDQLYQFLQQRQLITRWQSGFRQGFSTATALIHVTDTILNQMDKGNYTGIIFLDLKKAFDTVDHGILLEKLGLYGIEGSEHMWFKSYLLDRKQAVYVNGCFSDILPICCGVPQGSILGPLLLTLYMNDLPDFPKSCTTVLYADDTALLYSNHDISKIKQVLNHDLDIVSKCLFTNRLTLNLD